MLDEVGTAARIAGKRWEPALRDVDTLELARSDDERIEVSGRGETVATAVDTVVTRGLDALRDRRGALRPGRASGRGGSTAVCSRSRR